MTRDGTPVGCEGFAWDSDHAARAIVPAVMDLVQPQSVVDVGCGTGAWLAAFREQGVEDVLGLDAEYVNRSQLRIPVESFRAVDLAESLSAPRRYDLAVSLEVAEHLPPARAPGFVRDLVTLAPVVLFSAAVPGQGGRGHVNEQWPDYWLALFEEHGYRLVDSVRARFWDDRTVEPWYSQNSFFFVAPDHFARLPRLGEEAAHGLRMPLRAVHPELFTGYVKALQTRPLRTRVMNRIRRLMHRG